MDKLAINTPDRDEHAEMKVEGHKREKGHVAAVNVREGITENCNLI